MKINYLVTGTGRSGTVFMARFLTSVGIPCSHEMLFDYRGLDYAKERFSGGKPVELSWASRSTYTGEKSVEIADWLGTPDLIEAESSYMAAPYLLDEFLSAATIIHVVRDPVKVVNSFCNYIDFFKSHEPSNSYEDFIYQHVPELTIEMPAYDRAALYWVRWNQMVERRRADLFYRVEDSSELVMNFLGKTGSHFNDTTINTYKRPAEKFCIDKIKSKEILNEFVAMGKRYGYPMRSEYLLM